MENDKSAWRVLIGSIKNEKVRAVIMVLIAVIPLVWQQGLQNGWWGFLEGPLERVNRVMAMQYIGYPPLDRVKVIDTEEDFLEVQVFSTGDALVVRRTRRVDGSVDQQHRWITKAPLDKIVGDGWPTPAYAQPVTAPPANEHYVDRFLDIVDEYRIKIERSYENGCIEIIIINVATGQIEKTLSRICPERKKKR